MQVRLRDRSVHIQQQAGRALSALYTSLQGSGRYGSCAAGLLHASCCQRGCTTTGQECFPTCQLLKCCRPACPLYVCVLSVFVCLCVRVCVCVCTQDGANPAIVPRNHVMVGITAEAEAGNYEPLHRWVCGMPGACRCCSTAVGAAWDDRQQGDKQWWGAEVSGSAKGAEAATHAVSCTLQHPALYASSALLVLWPPAASLASPFAASHQ